MITLSPEDLAGLIAKAVAQGVTAALAQVQAEPVALTAKQARNRRCYERRRDGKGAVKEVKDVEAGVVEAGVVEAGVVEAGVVEAGVVEAGVVEAGVVEAGCGASDSVVFKTLSDAFQSDSDAFKTLSDGGAGDVVSIAPSPSSLSPTPPISPPPPALSSACTREEEPPFALEQEPAVKAEPERPNKKKSGRKRGDKQVPFSPPSLREMKAFASSLDPPLPELEVETAWYFYESKGWRVGYQGMRDWQAALQSWKRRWRKDEQGLTKNITTKGMVYGTMGSKTTAAHCAVSRRSDSANKPGRYA